MKKINDDLFWNGDDELLIMIHGFSDYPESLSLLGNYLSKNIGISITAPLLEAHKSDISKFENVKHSQWMKQIDELIKKNKNNYKKIYILGFSMGTFLSLYFSNQYNCIEKNIMIAPPFTFDLKHEFYLFISSIAKYFKKYNKKDLDQYGGNKNIYDRKMRKKYTPYYEKEPVSAIEEFNKLRKKAKAKLSKNKCDSLVILSKKDKVAIYKNYYYLKTRLNGNNKFVVLEKSGHIIPVDYEREQVFKNVKNFISEE